MNYRDVMEECAEYICAHLEENLTALRLARRAGYSLYHFCHVFRAYFDMPVGEYIRCRRLESAARDIVHGKTVITTAFDHGFNTHAGFTKAFRRHYGMSPREYYRQMKERSCFDMKPKIVKKESMKAFCYEISPEMNPVDAGVSAAYWCDVDFKNFPSYPRNCNAIGELGVWLHPQEDTGDLKYYFGYVTNDMQPAKGFVSVEIPAAKYAVFTAADENVTDLKEIAGEVKETWKYIFQEWFDSSNFVYDESKICFELYQGPKAEIYIPVK